ncbi:MAG: hypothetical protein ACUVR8_06470 [Acidobacteriota bacterium]
MNIRCFCSCSPVTWLMPARLVTTLPGLAVVWAVTFTVTDLNLQCWHDKGSDAPRYCTGYGSYRLLAGERPVAKGPESFEHIDVAVNTQITPNANLCTRQLADGNNAAPGHGSARAASSLAAVQ